MFQPSFPFHSFTSRFFLRPVQSKTCFGLRAHAESVSPGRATCPELMCWVNQFDVAVSVAKRLEYLHHQCDPPVIHGDIKSSNVLDRDFRAKIGDFGLARVMSVEDSGMRMVEEEEEKKKEGVEDCSSVGEEAESVVTNTTVRFDVDRSPESCNVRVLDSDASPEVEVVSPKMIEVEKSSVVSDGCFDKVNIDSGNHKKKGGGGGGSRRDRWWKQDNNGGGSESGRVKDYVMEWIGSEIKKERPKSEWVGSVPVSVSSPCSGIKTFPFS